MARPDFITGLLAQQYTACLHHSRRRRTALHWRSYPALAERTVETVAAIAADAYHPDHNPVAASLLAAHRDGPGTPADTEITLLLVAARPLVLVLDPGDRYHDSRASLWAAVARRLAVLDPPAVAHNPVPFLVALLGRIRPDATKHPSEPVPSPVHSNYPVEAALARHPAPGCDVPEAAIARLYLDAIRRDSGWRDLGRYALYGRTASGVHQSRVARHRRRVAEAVGYVA